MPLSTWYLRLAFWRLSSQWRSILTIIIGILLAAIIGASGPLYTSAIAQVGLKQRLDQYPLADIHIHSRTSLRGENTDDFAATWARFDQATQHQAEASFDGISGWMNETVAWAETAPLIPILDGRDLDGARFRVAHYAGWVDQVQLVSGIWPVDSANVAYDIEVALLDSLARDLDLQVGDTVVLDQRGWESSRLIRAKISGTVTMVDQASAYWSAPSPTRIDSNSQWRLETNLFTTRASLRLVAVDFVPQTSTHIGWRWTFDHSRLRYSEINAAIASASAFGANLEVALSEESSELASFVFVTDLQTALETYRGEVDLLTVPFLLFLLQLGGLVLFFLMVMGALVRRAERREIAMLQSRGALDNQLILLRGVEVATICVLVTVIAPTLARQLLVWFVPLFTGVDRLPLPLSSAAYAYAGVVSAAAFAVLMVTLLPVLKRPIVSAGGSHERNTGQTWWQSLNLDLILLVIGLAALWQMARSRSLLVETQSGETQADPLLLLTPTILIFAIGSVSLRLFPVVTRVVAHTFSRRSQLDWSMASWQVSREPLHYGRIAFLLASAISVGWFAISFNLMLATSRDHQAAYSAGADVRLAFSEVPARETAVTNVPEADKASVVTRIADINMVVGSNRASRTKGELLAIDNETFPYAAIWRFGLGSLAMPPPPPDLPVTGRQLPLVPETIQMWALFETAILGTGAFEMDPNAEFTISPLDLIERLEMTVRLRDQSGQIRSVPMAVIDPVQYYPPGGAEDQTSGFPPEIPPTHQWPNEGWLLLEGAVESPVAGPLSLDRLIVNTGQVFIFGVQPARLTVRDLTVVNSDLEATHLSWFAEPVWRFVNETQSVLSSEPIPVNLSNNRTGLQVAWMMNQNSSVYALTLDYPELITVQNSRSQGDVVPDDQIRAIPALVNTTFSDLNALVPGQRFRLLVDQSHVWFEVVEIIDYYPTLYPTRPFVIVDQALLNYTLRQRPLSTFVPNELWLRKAPEVTEEALLAALSESPNSINALEIHTYGDTLSALEEDLLLEGLLGLLFLTSVIGFILGLMSLVTYVSVNVQTRRVELAVMRALGFPVVRLIMSLVLESVLVMVVSIVVGLVTGLILSAQVLPGLSISTKGDPITPPPIVQLEATTLLLYLVAIGGLLVVELLVGAVLVRRQAILQTIRVAVE